MLANVCYSCVAPQWKPSSRTQMADKGYKYMPASSVGTCLRRAVSNDCDSAFIRKRCVLMTATSRTYTSLSNFLAVRGCLRTEADHVCPDFRFTVSRLPRREARQSRAICNTMQHTVGYTSRIQLNHTSVLQIRFAVRDLADR